MIQYSRDGSDRSRSRGVLDTPPSRGMTIRWDVAPRSVIARAAKQSILSLRGTMDCFASLAMTQTNRPKAFGTPTSSGRYLRSRHHVCRNSAREPWAGAFRGAFLIGSIPMDVQLIRHGSALKNDASGFRSRCGRTMTASSRPAFPRGSMACAGAAFTPASCWRSASPGFSTGWRSRWPARCPAR